MTEPPHDQTPSSLRVITFPRPVSQDEVERLREQVKNGKPIVLTKGATITSIRPNDSAPWYVKAAEQKRLCLAAGLVKGRSVYDVGAGAAKLGPLVEPFVEEYIPLDVDHPTGPWTPETQLRPVDTVVALEFIEHIDPAWQGLFVQWAVATAKRRVIISSPYRGAHAWYPRMDHFVGDDNPHHTREIDPYFVTEWIRDAQLTVTTTETLLCGLDGNDPSWMDGPPAYWMMVIDR